MHNWQTSKNGVTILDIVEIQRNVELYLLFLDAGGLGVLAAAVEVVSAGLVSCDAEVAALSLSLEEAESVAAFSATGASVFSPGAGETRFRRHGRSESDLVLNFGQRGIGKWNDATPVTTSQEFEIFLAWNTLIDCDAGYRFTTTNFIRRTCHRG